MRKKQLTQLDWIKWFKKYELGEFSWQVFFVKTGWKLPLSSKQSQEAKKRFRVKYYMYLNLGNNLFMDSKKKPTGRPKIENKDKAKEKFESELPNLTREELEEIARGYFDLVRKKDKSEAISIVSNLNLSMSSLEKVFSVSRQTIAKYRSGYQKPIRRKSKYEIHRDLISRIFKLSFKNYGRLKVSKELAKLGITISPRTVGNLMNKIGIKSEIRAAKKAKEYKVITDQFDDLVQRDFNPTEDNIVATDVKYIGCKEHEGIYPWIYLSVAISHKTKAIESFAISKSNDLDLVHKTLDNVTSRDNLIIHSDRGFQYSNPLMINLAKQKDYKISLKQSRDPLDNREPEYFFSILEVELLQKINTHTMNFSKVVKLITNYIKWYNNHRIQFRTNWKAPTEVSAYINC